MRAVAAAAAALQLLLLASLGAAQVATETEGALKCSSGEWRCADGSRCVPRAWRCDGRAHCTDASDELHCEHGSSVCRGEQFKCAGSGVCLAPSWRCDGEPDCGANDNSDEDPHMCQKDFKCRGNWARCATPVGGQFVCVPIYQFCDGRRDCIDGSDEWDICDNFTTSACAALHCEVGCRPTHDGLECYCNEGYEPNERGRCRDTDECALVDTCAQRCTNTVGSYLCGCETRYALHRDRRSCVAINDPPNEPMSLLVVTTMDVRRVWPESREDLPDSAKHKLSALNVRALDFLYSNRSVCYVHHNVSRAMFVCVRADNFTSITYSGTPTLFDDVSGVTHIAVDWMSNNWYFVDGEREAIYACDATLVYCRLLVDGALSKVHGFALDPTVGLMFWTVWGASPPRVERATLAGVERRAVAALKLVYPSALTLDPAAGVLYWLDAYLDVIERADYNGDGRRTLHRGFATQDVLLMSPLNEWLYVPLWRNSTVAMVSRYRGVGTASGLSLSAPPRVALVYHSARQPARMHVCAHSRGGCEHLCVTSYGAGSPRAQCLCRHGYKLVGRGHCVRVELDSYLVLARGSPPLVQALSPGGVNGPHGEWEAAAPVVHAARPTAADVDVTGEYLYYCDVHRYEIVRQKLDGSGREVFIGDDVDNCEGLAVDWLGRNLYWTDEALGRVSVARLDESRDRRVLVNDIRRRPRALALDPLDGTMYWSVWAESRAEAGRIEAAHMDGTDRRTLVSDSLHWPAGLALAPARDSLYWCDTYLDKIERLELSTARREVLLPAHGYVPVKPYGLALYDGAVIWSEHGTGAVRRLQSDGNVTELYSLPPPLYDIKLVSSVTRTGNNACRLHRGGCSELCLAMPGGERTCACTDGRALSLRDNTTCELAQPAPAHTCPVGSFACKHGRCIESLYVCDGDLDCPDGSDEDASPGGPCANVTCADELALRCDGNRCIPNGWICDGQIDCNDGGDETNESCARSVCGSQQWQCTVSKRCIPVRWRCDGAADCGARDLSDEHGCTAPCAPASFRCDSGSCVHEQLRCDSRADCNDASDERDCPQDVDSGATTVSQFAERDRTVCSPHQVQCDSGECVRQEFMCDGHADCLDVSDEARCPHAIIDVPTTTTEDSDVSTSAPSPPCDAPALRCDNSTRCVPLAQLCDGALDCADGADEADRCGEPMCELAACSHTCRPSPSGPVCSCPRTMQLSADGYTCASRGTCAEWGACAHTCTEHKGRRRCECDTGYRLADDGFTCKSTDGATPLLVFSNRHEVRAVELPARRAHALVSALKNTVALDWHGDSAGVVHLYWTDVVDDVIYRGLIEGGSLGAVEPVVRQGLTTAEGLAVDWIAGNLYWVESALQQIEVARLDGAFRRTLIAGDMDSPRALALDPRNGYLFWSDWEQSAPRIERASLAGRRRAAVVRVDALADGAWPNGISLDYRAHRLYWVDARTDSIHTTDYDGGDHRVVLRDHPTLSHPFAITVFEEHVYWTDWRSNSVVRANKWNGSDVTVVQRTLTQPFDVKVIHPSRQPTGAHNPCAMNNGGCSHLCLIDAPGERACACPHLMRLNTDAATCQPHEIVLLVARAGEIRGVDLDTSGEQLVPAVSGAQLAAPHSINFVSADGLVYWADAETNEIRSARLTGGGMRVVADGAALRPRGFALDWAARLLYYMSGASLVVSDLAGERATVLLQPLHNVTAMTVDPHRGKLYWALTEPARIEVADGDGSNRRVLPTGSLQEVTDMCVDVQAHRLYWVDTGVGALQYIDLYNNQMHTFVLGVGARPEALDVYGDVLLWADGGSRAVLACDKHTCAPDTVRTVRARTGGVLALRVYDAKIQRGGGGACAMRRVHCAHLCLPVSDVKSVCRCAGGYARDGDDTTCTAVDEVLVYSASWELRGVALNSAYNASDEPLLPPLAQLSLAASIDYEVAGEWLYWVDSEAGALWRVKRDGTSRQLLLSQPEPLDTQPSDWVSGLAVDWLNSNVYWSEPRRRLVLVSRTDGTHRYVLLDTDPLAVTSLSVDPVRGYIFMAGGGWLQRARLDGTELALLHNGTSVTDVALDTEYAQVYWVEAREACVRRVSYTGGAVQLVVCLAAERHHPVALALHRRTIYWLDTIAHGGSVLAASFKNVSDYRILRAELGDGLRDVLVWARKAQPAAKDACDGRCEALCLAGRCACPHGRLAADNATCTPHEAFLMYSRVTEIASVHLDDGADLNAPYPPIRHKELMRNVVALAYSYEAGRLFYSDIQRGTINTVYYNGTGHEVLLERAGTVEGIVYGAATNTLYWTCTAAPALRAASIDALLNHDARISTILRLERGARPRGIDFEPCERRLYWTDWGTGPGVRRAYVSGRGLQTVVGTGILMPNALVLDHVAKHLYWADARLDRIERAHYDGSHRALVTRTRTAHPFALALAGDWIYWSDWVAHAVLRADKLAGDASILRSDVPRPMGVVAVARDLQTCSTAPCEVLNGGCAERCEAGPEGGVRCACTPGRVLAADGRACRPEGVSCLSQRFACADGACVPEELVCDGVSHCMDGSDEELYYCTSRVCIAGRVPCGAGGRCVLAEQVCDGRMDCDDGADEAECPCLAEHLRCDDGACVPLAARCDGAQHCADGSDERDCPTCLGDRCREPTTDFNAIVTSTVTEPEVDLEADEGATRCSTAQFTCGSGECVPLEWRCDGRADCADASDETDRCGHVNGTCAPEQWRCGATGPCVQLGARCDGLTQCPRGEDEAGCACHPPAPRCTDTGLCLHPSMYCDGDADCEDGSDEPDECATGTQNGSADATAPCGGGALACTGRCVSPELVCDGRNHCGDSGPGTDEDPLLCHTRLRGAGRGACPHGHLQCANGACVTRGVICDGTDDCGDYSDEWRCGVDECSVHNGGCSHGCSRAAGGRACWCRIGWRLLPDGRACTDVDECAEDAPCDHNCRNTPGSFVCSCSDGYRLMADGVTCSSTSSVRASLIFANRYYIRRVSTLNARDAPITPDELLQHALDNAVALDMHWATGCLYWSDVTPSSSALWRACGEMRSQLHGGTLRSPDGLAVDWVGGNLYWCDKGADTLEVSRLDGAHRRVLLRGGLSEPRALALHPRRGELYWSDWGAIPHIGRAGMDGSRRTVLVATGLHWPNALTVDYAADVLYFADARRDYIGIADLDSGAVRVLLSRERMPWLRLHHVFGLAVWEGRVYWSDWETRAIESCLRRPVLNLSAEVSAAGSAYDCRTVVRTVHKPMDLRVYHPARQPPVNELSARCAALNCSGLCLLTPAGPGAVSADARCECPEHWTLSSDGRSCTPNCTAAHFVCERTLKCVPYWWRCDTQDDCGDGSDEPPTCPPFRCAPGQYQCDGGRCVHPARLCDGNDDCGDGSDERDCDHFACLTTQWRCRDNATAGVSARCVSAGARCDGHRDCHDGDDELSCPARTCPPHHFTCARGGCVPQVWVCDADADCADGSDEGDTLCARRTCAADEYRCESGRCVPREWLCDGEPDCARGEDESHCGAAPPCDPTYFRCPDARCLPGRWRCDGDDDCGDGADEIGCAPRACSESEFRCASGECVRGTLKCSGAPDCADGSDEHNCTARCAAGARACASGDCALAITWCDGELDCDDGSDELHCAAPPRDCAAALPPAWTCDTRADCPGAADELPVLCASRACPHSTLRCKDNTCVPLSLVCDGFADCDSDEEPTLCNRHRWTGDDSACRPDELMCDDGRCLPAGALCDEQGPCRWDTCPQLCLPKEHTYTCKCAPGFRQRALPDNSTACEAPGDAPLVLVGEAGAVLPWRAQQSVHADKHHPAPPEPEMEPGAAAVRCVTGAPLDGVWWTLWGDDAGWLRRARLDTRGVLGAAERVLNAGAAIHGCALEAGARRAYWTSGTGVHVATLDGSARVTLHTRAHSVPGDLVLHATGGRMYWTEYGAESGVMSAALDGTGARWLVKRRVRRVSALALDQWARRLYFVDGYYDTLESVRLDGGERVLHARFIQRPAGAPSAPHAYIAGVARPMREWSGPVLPGRACARLAVWEESVWCASRGGLWRISRRAAPRVPAAPPRPLTAIALLHPLMYAHDDTGGVVCGAGACDASALCVRGSTGAPSCLCPDGLTTLDELASLAARKCVNASENATCTLSCGAGSCMHIGGEERCACPPLFGGTRCQHYRCARHCHGRGRCELDPTAPSPPAPAPPPLRCVCSPGYSGPRCESALTTTTDTPEAVGTACDCEHGGRCVLTDAGSACACSGPWGGARCQVYVGHDHACNARACASPAVCVWASTATPAVRCACPADAQCLPERIVATSPPLPTELPSPASALGAWAGALLALLLLVTAALCVLRRRRARSWSHARLADNLEISNPMYLAGEDEPEATAPRAAGARHFANPVYESAYEQRAPAARIASAAAAEEHANLLSAERAALL